MKKSKLILLCLAVFSTLVIQSQPRKNRKPKTSSNFILEPIGKGVWAAINNDQFGKSICNAGIIDLGDRVLVFDAFMNPTAAQELKEMAEEITGKTVGLVINSHYHNDHIRGNQVFAHEATIISTNYTRKQIESIEPGDLAREERNAPGLLQATRRRLTMASSSEKEELSHWIGYYEGMVETAHDLKVTVPNITFNDSLWITGSDRSVKLLECRNGHTPSDVVLLIPEEGIAFMGDLLFTERHPWIADGDPKGWQESLKFLYEDPKYKIYVPGHGPVGNKESLRQLYTYLHLICQMAGDANTEELRTALLTSDVPQQFQSWMFTRFYQPNIQFLLQKK